MADLIGKWYHEDLGHGAVHSMKFGDVLYTAVTPFQKVEVVQTEAYGYALMLDGVLNSAEKDEYIYHESLVQPAMLAHPSPKTVFIGGGGEGGTLREVLRHPGVEKCVMVDIDGDLVEVFKKDLPQWHQGAFDDPRTELIYDDCIPQLENYDGLFDVIILDLADPVEAGPAFPIWTQEYYKTCFAKLSPDGVCVTQAGPLSTHQVSEICTPVAKTLASVFPTVLTYGCHIPSFGHMWAYNIALKNDNGYSSLQPAAIDAMLVERLGADKAAALGWCVPRAACVRPGLKRCSVSLDLCAPVVRFVCCGLALAAIS
eukprot:SAG22_NODE_1535_length_4200_cov_301.283346_2_plen_314_part_00